MLPTQADAVDRIIELHHANNPRAVKLSVEEVDAYLGSFRDPAGKKTYRDQLIAELRERGPKTPLMDRIIVGIEEGKTHGGSP